VADRLLRDLSYFLTGQNRKYDRSSGAFGRVVLKPGRLHGAWETGLRYSDTNLNAKSIRGGRFSRASAALSYFQSVHWRYEVNVGLGRLDRFDQVGNTTFLQGRIQYEL
jgi:phosphate-selective porin OprO/OprP